MKKKLVLIVAEVQDNEYEAIHSDILNSLQMNDILYPGGYLNTYELNKPLTKAEIEGLVEVLKDVR